MDTLTTVSSSCRELQLPVYVSWTPSPDTYFLAWPLIQYEIFDNKLNIEQIDALVVGLILFNLVSVPLLCCILCIPAALVSFTTGKWP